MVTVVTDVCPGGAEDSKSYCDLWMVVELLGLEPGSYSSLVPGSYGLGNV